MGSKQKTKSNVPGLFTIALKRLCPECYQPGIFSGFLKLKDHCDHCGCPLGSQDNADGPAFFIVFFMGFVTVGLAILLEIFAAPPYWVHVVIWPIFILAGSLLLLPPLKALMIALHVRHQLSPKDKK